MSGPGEYKLDADAQARYQNAGAKIPGHQAAPVPYEARKFNDTDYANVCETCGKLVIGIRILPQLPFGISDIKWNHADPGLDLLTPEQGAEAALRRIEKAGGLAAYGLSHRGDFLADIRLVVLRLAEKVGV